MMKGKFPKQAKFWLSAGLLAVLFGGIVWLTFEKTKNIFGQPDITVRGIVQGETRTDPRVTIEGQAKNIKFLSLNDREIFVSLEGNFRESLILSPGYNIITLKAEDKFGKKTEKAYEVVYKPEADSVQELPENVPENNY